MKFRKVCNLALVLLIIFALAGCGSNNNTSPGSWSTAKLIENNGGDAELPRIATDASGNVMAVWQQSGNIWSNRFFATTGVWGTASLISNTPVSAQFAQVAVDSIGNAVAVWHQSDSNNLNIWSNRYTASTNSWGTAELIQTNTTGFADHPQVASDSTGNAIVVWSQSDGIRTSIWSNHFNTATKSWGTATEIETDNIGNASDQQVAFDTSGNAVAVWSQFDGTNNFIWSNRYNAATGIWGTASPIETTPGAAFSPQIAFDASGNTIVIWIQSNLLVHNIWANRYTATTNSWGTAELIQLDISRDALHPKVAFDASGNAVAVWAQSDGYNYSIWANRFTAVTKNWKNAHLIDIGTLGSAFSPQIAFDASGNAMVIWSRLSEIWSNRYAAATNSWEAAKVINTVNLGASNSPQIAVGASGNAVAVWSQYDGQYFSLMSNLYP